MKQAQVFSTSYELPEKIWVGIGTYHISSEYSDVAFGTYRTPVEYGKVALRYLNQPGFPVSDDIVKVYPDIPFVDAVANEPVVVFFRKGKSGAKAVAVTSLRREPGLCAAILETAARQQSLMTTIEKYSEHVFAEVDRVLQTYLTDPRFIRKDGKLMIGIGEGFFTVKVKKGCAYDMNCRYPSRFIYIDDETLGIRGLK